MDLPPPAVDASAPETAPRRERRKHARPRELLAAALSLFVEKGFSATRAEEVAARAGVSKGTLFLYFPTKEDLLKGVVHEYIGGRFGEWNAEFDGFEGSTADILRYAMHRWWESTTQNDSSCLCKLMVSEGHNFPELSRFYEDTVVRPGQALMRRILERGVARGEFRPMDIEQTVHCITGPMVYLMLMRHSMHDCLPTGFTDNPSAYLALQADVLLHGLMRQPESPT